MNFETTKTSCSYISSLVQYFLLVGLSVVKVESWSSGASSVSCRSLYPVHGTQPQNFICPYTIRTNKETIFSNESVTVTIEGDWFKGFVMLAKPTGRWQQRSQESIGVFRNTPGVKVFDCYDDKDNGITHSHSQYNDDVEVEWTPPNNFEGRVTFVATVVKSFKIFWISINSSPVWVKKSFKPNRFIPSSKSIYQIFRF